MPAAGKYNERRPNGARNPKSRVKCITSAREAKRTNKGAPDGDANCAGAIAIYATEEEIVRRPRMELADALRARGVDEHGLAELYVHAFNKVRRFIFKDADPKRSLDNLKELSRVLESKRANDRPGERGGAQVVVQLVHQVARPDREAEAADSLQERSTCESREVISPEMECYEPEMCAIDVRDGETCE